MVPTSAPLIYDEDSIPKNISATGRIPQHAFKASIQVFFSLAVLSVIGRIMTRIYTRRRLDADDYFLIFGLLCLGAGTVLVHLFCQTIFFIQAIQIDPPRIFPADQYEQLSKTYAAILSFLCIIWTAIFAIKFSFLALFRLLIRRLPKPIIRYYWITVGVTITTWLFFIAEPWIYCPYTDKANHLKHCTPQTPYVLTTTLTAFVTSLDIATDIMIVSIPIIVLRKSQLKMYQKLGLSVLMGLSAVMAIVAIVRMSGFRIGGANHHKVYDLVWQLYWHYMEGCIACIMASVAAFRSLFIVKGTRPNKQHEQKPSWSTRQRLLQKPKTSRVRGGRYSMSGDEDQLPVIPTATFSSVRKFIRRTNNPIENPTELSVTCLRGDEKIKDSMDKNQIYISNELNVTSQRVSLER